MATDPQANELYNQLSKRYSQLRSAQELRAPA
jgi:hypothetical protein